MPPNTWCLPSPVLPPSELSGIAFRPGRRTPEAEPIPVLTGPGAALDAQQDEPQNHQLCRRHVAAVPVANRRPRRFKNPEGGPGPVAQGGAVCARVQTHVLTHARAGPQIRPT